MVCTLQGNYVEWGRGDWSVWMRRYYGMPAPWSLCVCLCACRVCVVCDGEKEETSSCTHAATKHGNIFKLYVYRYLNKNRSQLVINRPSEPGVTVFGSCGNLKLWVFVFWGGRGGFIICNFTWGLWKCRGDMVVDAGLLEEYFISTGSNLYLAAGQDRLARRLIERKLTTVARYHVNWPRIGVESARVNLYELPNVTSRKSNIVSIRLVYRLFDILQGVLLWILFGAKIFISIFFYALISLVGNLPDWLLPTTRPLGPTLAISKLWITIQTTFS